MQMVAMAAAAAPPANPPGGNGNDHNPTEPPDNDDDNDFYWLKNDVLNKLGKYSSVFKLSFFGHHHQGRVTAVMKAIKQYTRREQIIRILENQQAMLQGKYIVQEIDHLDLRWSSSRKIVNKKEDYTTSGYYKAVSRALALTTMQFAVSVSPRSPTNR